MSGTSITIIDVYYVKPCTVNWGIRVLYMYCLANDRSKLSWWNRIFHNSAYRLEKARKNIIRDYVVDLHGF